MLLLLLLHKHHVDLSSLPLLLHLLVLRQKLLLQVIILLLLRASILLLRPTARQDVGSSSLQLILDGGKLTNLLLLQLLDLFLDCHLILMVLIHLSAVNDCLGAVAAYLGFALGLVLVARVELLVV